MGEAKIRRRNDQFFGQIPKAGKGIVVSPPITIERNNSLTGSGGIDPIELRRAILFWDRIIKPTNNLIYFGLSEDEEFLKKCGIFEEMEVRFSGSTSSIGKTYAQLHIAAFLELERKEPGLWAMSEGERSFNLQAGGDFLEGRGALVELHRAIPLPTGDVPLADLLQFKDKRRDEIISLTLELDGLFSRVSNAVDKSFELQRAIREIDKKCNDIVRVGKESNINFSLSEFTFGVSLEANSKDLVLTGGLGALLGSYFEMPTVGAAVGVASSVIKLSAGLGGRLGRGSKSARLALSPSRVVSRLIDEPL